MIYAAVAGMVEGTLDSCKDVTYKDPADLGESGCGEGPMPEKRNPPPPEEYWDEETGERQLRKRISPGDAGGTVDDMICTYSTDVCEGPKIISECFYTPIASSRQRESEEFPTYANLSSSTSQPPSWGHNPTRISTTWVSGLS